MRIIVTGASGWLANTLAYAVKADLPDTKLIGVSRKPTADSIWDLYIDNDSYIEGFKHETSDIVVHSAFCRMSNGRNLVESLDWSARVFRKATIDGVQGIVNISSQSVYGGELSARVEEAPMDPGYLYAMAKASTEILLDSIVKSSKYKGRWTNLRLASLVGVSVGTCPNNVLRKFCEKALCGEDLIITGGNQYFSFLDVHDAANAIIMLLEKGVSKWNTIYNVGMNEQINIIELANDIVQIVFKELGYPKVEIQLVEGNSSVNSGMVCEYILDDIGWLPKKTIKEIIRDTIYFVEKGDNDVSK